MNITFRDIENKNRIIEGMKNTIKSQSEKIERYEKTLKLIAEGKTERGMEVNRIWLMRMAEREIR